MNEDQTKAFLRELDYRLMLRGESSIFSARSKGVMPARFEKSLEKWLTQQVVAHWVPLRRRRRAA